MACRRVDRILWIEADTVRADYLGYNGGHVRTPNIDALPARSTVFDRHYAVSFPTVPARYDFLVGQAAYAGVGWNALPREEQTVASFLSEAGFTSAGIADSPFFTREGFNYDGAHPLVDLDHGLVQHLGKLDVKGEEVRTVLVADPQRVLEPARGYEQRALACSLEQCVRGDRGAHTHRLDGAGVGIGGDQPSDAPMVGSS